MKKALIYSACTLLVLFIFAPWLLMLIDLFTWITLGHAVTHVDRTDGLKNMLSLVWPLVTGWALMPLVVALMEEADQ